MKLRNKKTGDIGDYLCVIQDDDIKLWNYNNNYENYCYKSLSEFDKDWEDYEAVEPLIEDPKARKVFRGWADLLGAKRFRVEHLCKFGGTIIASTDLPSDPAIEIPGYIGEYLGTYTREELCGEEE